MGKRIKILLDLFGNRHSRENGKLDARLVTLDSRRRGNDKLGVSEQVYYKKLPKIGAEELSPDNRLF